MCPKCGAPASSSAAFCSACGNNLASAAVLPPAPPIVGMPAAVPVIVQSRTSGMAIAGFVLSFFCGVLGLIFSIIGYNESKRSGGTVTGEGLGLAGIIISIFTLLAQILYLVFVVWAVNEATSHHRNW
jgi:hypothetical protein